MAMSKYTPEQIVSAFWAKVDKSGGDDACWIWTAGRIARGYGAFNVNRKMMYAHRFAYGLLKGEIPDGLYVLHDCPDGDNPLCVNPAHLWLGTHGDNMADMAKKGRHFSKTRPERCARGKRHGTHTHPERVARGEHQGVAKLTESQVREIRRRFAVGGVTKHLLAKEYGVDRSTIRRLILRDTWQHVTDADEA